MNEIINCVAYANGRRVENVALSEISGALKQPDRFIWIGLHEPSEGTLRQVQQEFRLHDLAIEDAHRAHQRPKIEMYDDSVFVVLRTALVSSEKRHVDFGETHIFLGARYIVSVRHGSSLSYRDVRSRCETTPRLLSKGPGFALYALMDSIVDHISRLLTASNRNSKRLRTKSLVRPSAARRLQRFINLSANCSK